MRTIGLIGGVSWKSSLEYYKLINEGVHDALGGWNSAKIILISLNFNEIDFEHRTKDWEKSDQILIDSAKKLEKSGADFILLCANTAHVLADKIQNEINIPLLHIADATAEKIKSSGIKKVGLLGTKHTMNENFYKERLKEKHGIEVIVPNEEYMEVINKEINNIILGKTNSETKGNFLKVINELIKEGSQGIVLGCTEIPLLIKQKDIEVPIFDTMYIHSEAAVRKSLE